jgi:hypothetical protein
MQSVLWEPDQATKDIAFKVTQLWEYSLSTQLVLNLGIPDFQLKVNLLIHLSGLRLVLSFQCGDWPFGKLTDEGSSSKKWVFR